ncbi:Abi family protein [Pseudoalteromonas sp. MT33b]|nr:Abi family protein [Pseudoalteromonas sp. MT33b]
MRPNNLNIVFDSLSQPRINAYKRYFGNQLSDDEVYNCYLWNDAISKALFNVITQIEITLRNRMHVSLSNHLYNSQKIIVDRCNGNPRIWNTSNTSTIGTVTSCNWYEAGLLENKSMSKIHTTTHHYRNKTPLLGRARPSPDDVVSSLHFGFWSSLIDKNPNVQWRNLLAHIFPKHRASNSSQWNVVAQQKRLTYRLELVRDIRNRIAHHEPLWKTPRILDETPPTQGSNRAVLHPPSSAPSESIQRLRIIYSKITELLRWMSQELYDDLMNSATHSHFLWLCSTDGLNFYIKHHEVASGHIKSCKFKREIGSIIKMKKSVFLVHGKRGISALHPI